MAERPDAVMLEQLEKALLGLPLVEREVFLAVRFDGLSYAEIAARTGRSVPEIERRFAAALRAIQREIWEGRKP